MKSVGVFPAGVLVLGSVGQGGFCSRVVSSDSASFIASALLGIVPVAEV